MWTEGRTPFTPNVVIGFGVALLGVVLTLDKLNLVDATTWLRFWPVLLVLFGASIVAQALAGGPAERSAPPVLSAPLIIFLIVGGVLASRVTERTHQQEAVVGSGAVSVTAVMSSNRREVHENAFRGAEMTAVMGDARLDLRKATVAPGEEVVVDVFTIMGSTMVYVPEGWEVDVEAVPVMGGVKDERRRTNQRSDVDAAPAPTATDAPPALEPEAQTTRPPRVVLRGFILMGGLVIRS